MISGKNFKIDITLGSLNIMDVSIVSWLLLANVTMKPYVLI